jgi:hypothetical protein
VKARHGSAKRGREWVQGVPQGRHSVASLQ